MTHAEFECISELSKQDKRNFYISEGKVILKRKLPKKPTRKQLSTAGTNSSLRQEINKLKQENSRLREELSEVSMESVRKKIDEVLQEKKELSECKTQGNKRPVFFSDLSIEQTPPGEITLSETSDYAERLVRRAAEALIANRR